MKKITPQQHTEMMEFLDDLAQAVRVRRVEGSDREIRIFSDEFEAVTNLRESYLALKAREDERLARLVKMGRKTSAKKTESSRANLEKANKKLAENPGLRRKAKIVKKTPIVSEP